MKRIAKALEPAAQKVVQFTSWAADKSSAFALALAVVVVALQACVFNTWHELPPMPECMQKEYEANLQQLNKE